MIIINSYGNLLSDFIRHLRQFCNEYDYAIINFVINKAKKCQN